MTVKRFENRLNKSNIKSNTLNPTWDNEKEDAINVFEMIDLLNDLSEENERLKEDWERCRAWLNSDKYDYELTLAFIKNKGYSLKDVLEYEKAMQND